MTVNTTIEALEHGYVEGIKFGFKDDLLAKLMRERAAYHEGRAKTKRDEIPQLKKSFEAIKGQVGPAASVSHMNKASNYHANPDDVLEQLEEDIKGHENSATKLRFYADNLIPGKLYILGEGDLRSIEVVKS